MATRGERSKNDVTPTIRSPNSSAVVDPDFTAGPFVTRRSTSAGELSSLLSSMYLQNEDELSIHEDKLNDEDAICSDGASVTVSEPAGQPEQMDADDDLKQELSSLRDNVKDLENRFTDSLTSSLNREGHFRDYVDASFAKLEESLTTRIERLEKDMVNCLLRRDERWKNQLKTLTTASPPVAQRTIATSTPVSHIVPSTPIYSQLSRPSGATPFYTKPPVRLDFPTFGDKTDSDALSFIEQCENYLDLRPLPNYELLGTLSAVLKGPALSWWKATKADVKDWVSFKEAFLSAFLPTDYLSEVEEKLRTTIQQPDQCIRDFAYDYRALCLKWKPDMPEEEMVRRILNNVNPKVAGCLRGTVSSVSQLVKIGSMVEKDCTGVREYWQKVHASSDRPAKRPTEKKITSKGTVGVTIGQQNQQTNGRDPKLLVVPVTIRGVKCEAVLDTGSTFTLMKDSLWRNISHMKEPVQPVNRTSFVMADGTVHQALGKKTLRVEWHGGQWPVDMHIMDEGHLAFPLILGLDFLTRTGAILNLAKNSYGLKTDHGYIFHV